MRKAFGKDLNTLPGLRAATTQALARSPDDVATKSGLSVGQLVDFASGKKSATGPSRASIKAAVGNVYASLNPDTLG